MLGDLKSFSCRCADDNLSSIILKYVFLRATTIIAVHSSKRFQICMRGIGYKQEFTRAHTHHYNDVTECSLGIVEAAAMTARIHTKIVFRTHIQLAETK